MFKIITDYALLTIIKKIYRKLKNSQKIHIHIQKFEIEYRSKLKIREMH